MESWRRVFWAEGIAWAEAKRGERAWAGRGLAKQTGVPRGAFMGSARSINVFAHSVGLQMGTPET